MSESKQKHIPSRFETEWCPKMLREHLCTQQTFAPDRSTRDEISRLIAVLDLHRPIGTNGKHGERHTPTCGCEDIQVMSDEKWVTLTPEQVEALDQGVIVRAHEGDTMVQGPLDSVSSAGRCVGIGSSPHARFYLNGPVEVRERDVPKPELLPLGKVGADDLVDELADLVGAWRRQDPEQVPRASIDRIKAALVPEDDRPLTVEEKAEILYQLGKVRAALRGETS